MLSSIRKTICYNNEYMIYNLKRFSDVSSHNSKAFVNKEEANLMRNIFNKNTKTNFYFLSAQVYQSTKCHHECNDMVSFVNLLKTGNKLLYG